MSYEYDILVVGCGAAGLSAALTAAKEGAHVGLLERSTKDVRGANTRYTESYLRLKSETEVTDDFESKLAENSGGYIEPDFLEATLKSYEDWPPMLKAYSFADPQLIMTFADRVPDTIAWLKNLGLRFEMEAMYFLAMAAPRMAPVGGGEAIVETLAGAAEKEGVSFHYETTAKNLILDEKGVVIGVRAWSKATGLADFKAKVVILASGGFEGNAEMLAKYIGKESYLLRPVAPGVNYNKGEGINMALAIGAAPAGQYGSFHAEPIDPRSALSEPVVFTIPYGILVNKHGERFVDEGANFIDLVYEPLSRDFLKQPEGMVYFICDAKLKEIKNYQRAIRSDQPPIAAESVEELAAKLGIAPTALRKTIDGYNAAVQPGEYDPFSLDGKHTEGVYPPKSNWAQTIDQPEFLAYPIVCSVVFTFGGLKVTPQAEVLNSDGYAIPGLYAAGEVIGMYYRNYPGSTSVLKALVFGRIAAEQAIKVIK